MIVMASDHASGAFNAGRLNTDSAFLPQVELEPVQFLFRWLSHLCAPTFLLLAGTSLALSIERRAERGESGYAIDRDLLVRGFLILGVDLFVVNWFWYPGVMLMQVMYAIGLSMVLMIPARRLPTVGLVGLALAVLVVAELFFSGSMTVPPGFLPAVRAALVGGGLITPPIRDLGTLGQWYIAYPVLPWWAMMALGWGFGRFLIARRDDPGAITRWTTIAGAAGLALYAVVRGVNGYGTMGLLRTDGSLIEWLHVSKYPPALAYAGLELGLAALTIAGLFVLQRRIGERFSPSNPVLVFGQTAFFFYVAHIVLLQIAARALGLLKQGTLGTAIVATVAALVVLYPACLGYRRFKADHPRSVLRFF